MRERKHMYQVKINNNGSYTVLSNGNPVSGAKVKSITFPEIKSHTLEGTIHHIAGPGQATIELPDGTTIINVPLIN